MTSQNGAVEVKGLLFDNDGVLIDSTAAAEASWRSFASWYDLPADDVIARVHGRRSRDVIAHYTDRLPVPSDEAFARDGVCQVFLDGSEYLFVGYAAVAAVLGCLGGCEVAQG